MPETLGGLPLLYRGSVKDVYGAEGRAPYVFAFSDRYSVFDWGEMPDALPGKGEALAAFTDIFFRELSRRGVAHHSRGLVDAGLSAQPKGKPSRYLAVDPVRVIRPAPGRDYSAYGRERPTDALVPLEVVFRFGAPAGSSFLKRAAEIPGYARSLGLAEEPAAGAKFSRPVVEFFTKLEPTDRFLPESEARQVAGLSESEIASLKQVTISLAGHLKEIFQRAGIELWDGKFEFSFTPGAHGQRSFRLVDAIGPDELRLMRGDLHLSKEILRRFYRPTDWYAATEQAKRKAAETGGNWLKICREEMQAEPAPLPVKIKSAAAAMYPALTNAIAEVLGEAKPFPAAPSLEAVAADLKEIP